MSFLDGILGREFQPLKSLTLTFVLTLVNMFYSYFQISRIACIKVRLLFLAAFFHYAFFTVQRNFDLRKMLFTTKIFLK